MCDLTQSYAEAGGGIRTYLHEKRRYLLRHTPHRHLLVVPGDRDAEVTEGRATTVTLRSPHVPGSTAYRLMLRNRAVRRVLAAHRPDVIETLDAYNLPWAALAHRRAFPETAVIGGYRTDFPRAYVGAYGRRLLGAALPDALAGALADRAVRLSDRYAGRLYRRMDRVYALSAQRAAALDALGIPDVAVLPLGVDLDTFRPQAAHLGQRAEWDVPPDGGPVLVYAGRLDTEKRPDVLLDAVARLPASLDATLVLLGDGPMRAALADQARALRDRGRRVVVAGYVHDRTDLARALASADVYVSAMAHETFGISIIEAQACGLPVVGVASGAMPARVPPEVGRLARPGDPDAFAQTLLDLLADDVEAMGRAARAHVESRFGWARTFEQLLVLYAEARRARSGAVR